MPSIVPRFERSCLVCACKSVSIGHWSKKEIEHNGDKLYF